MEPRISFELNHGCALTSMSTVAGYKSADNGSRPFAQRSGNDARRWHIQPLNSICIGRVAGPGTPLQSDYSVVYAVDIRPCSRTC